VLAVGNLSNSEKKGDMEGVDEKGYTQGDQGSPHDVKWKKEQKNDGAG